MAGPRPDPAARQVARRGRGREGGDRGRRGGGARGGVGGARAGVGLVRTGARRPRRGRLGGLMSETTYKGAINKAIVDALLADDDVFFFGEDVGAAGGAFKPSVGIQERFGPRRVLDTPISEQAIVGLAIGAAMKGLRPLAEIMFADF